MAQRSIHLLTKKYSQSTIGATLPKGLTMQDKTIKQTFTEAELATQTKSMADYQTLISTQQPQLPTETIVYNLSKAITEYPTQSVTTTHNVTEIFDPKQYNNHAFWYFIYT